MVELIRSHNYVVTSSSFRENSGASQDFIIPEVAP